MAAVMHTPIRKQSEDQIASYRDAFALFDIDNSGTISSDELARVMTLFGQNPSDAEISSIMEKLDMDQSGTIEFEEFVHLMSSTDVDAELWEAFRVFDKDGSGNINFEELRLVMRNLGEKLTDGELVLMIKEADLNGDNEISFEEFKKEGKRQD